MEVAEILDRLGIEPSGTWVADIPSRPDVFSIDVDPAVLNGQRRLEAINLYVGNPASRVPAGFSYRWTANGPTLSNVYQRFPRSMAESAHAQLSAALHVDDVGRLLWDGLLPCDSLHVANKSRSDGLYYGGLDSAGLACVLERTKSHHQIQAYLPNAGSRLQHLCFDVGIDIQRGRSGYAKVAIYGVL